MREARSPEYGEPFDPAERHWCRASKSDLTAGAVTHLAALSETRP